MLKLALNLAIISALPLLSSCGQKSASMSSTLTADDVEHATLSIREVATPPDVARAIQDKLPKGPIVTLDAGSDPVGTASSVINLGKAAWDLIKSNKGVVNVSTDIANALPSSVKSAAELSNWSDVQFHSYHVEVKSALTGVNMATVTLTVAHQFGGKNQGKGSYLSGVTVVPSDIWNAYSISINGTATVISTTNVGSMEDPIGSISMALQIKVDSAMNTREVGGILQFRGDSAGATFVGN